MSLREQYTTIREASESICQPLQKEDYVVQPVVDVSPPKWHLGHTTWFWETFALLQYFPGYQAYNPDYNFVFNSYYETIGARVIRTDRGNLSRPSVDEVYAYRKHVDAAMMELLMSLPVDPALEALVLLGLNHEQQHQELLWSDIKYILGHNPLFPAYSRLESIDGVQAGGTERAVATGSSYQSMAEGIYEIGYQGRGFCFDNELSVHKVYLRDYGIAAATVTNGEYMAFIESGGYENFRYWHAEGWDWVKKNAIAAPLYWHLIDDTWYQYTLSGLRPVTLEEPVCHVSYYEAAAYASWKGRRLPTEWEWEAASDRFSWGKRWEWTESAYLPYPGFTKAPGAIGEYNGKFMVSQMVLRGASVATPAHHSRNTYRNFFHPHLRWQFTGIRLAV